MENQINNSPEISTGSHKARFIKLIVVLLILLLALFLIFYFIERNFSAPMLDNQNTKNQTNNMPCRENDSCCIESLNIVKANQYQIIEGDEKCPDGFKESGLRCESSLVWCEPMAVDRDMTINEIKYPDSEKGIALKLHIDSAGIKMLDDYAIVGGHPNFLPGKYEFMAEIIAGNDVLGEYGFSDPRLIEAEIGYDGPSFFEATDFTLIIPYFEKADTINIYNKGAMALTIDMSRNEAQSQLANPASVFCVDQGGRLEIKTDENGGQFGVCKFSNGKECEEWSFFRGSCSQD